MKDAEGLYETRIQPKVRSRIEVILEIVSLQTNGKSKLRLETK